MRKSITIQVQKTSEGKFWILATNVETGSVVYDGVAEDVGEVGLIGQFILIEFVKEAGL